MQAAALLSEVLRRSQVIFALADAGDSIAVAPVPFPPASIQGAFLQYGAVGAALVVVSSVFGGVIVYLYRHYETLRERERERRDALQDKRLEDFKVISEKFASVVQANTESLRELTRAIDRLG